MVENLKDVQERAEETRRAGLERREPDYSEKNLALYRVPQHVNDPNQRDENRAEPQAVTSVPEEVYVVEIEDVASVVDEKPAGKHTKGK